MIQNSTISDHSQSKIIPVVGIAGGSGSGKTTLAREAMQTLNHQVTLIPFDSYYRDLSLIPEEERGKTNFDHPDALEISLLQSHLLALKLGQAIPCPMYDFVTHTRTGSAPLTAEELIFIEGTLILAIPEIHSLIDLSFFIDIPDDIRLLRRIRRDMDDRGRSFNFIEMQYMKMVRPMYQQYILPSRTRADHILNGEESISRLTQIVKEKVETWMEEQSSVIR
ncbi:MAG: uridine kinase [bacterium]